MPDNRLASPAPVSILSSPVTNEPLGRLVICSLLIGFAVLALPLGIALWSYWKLASGLLLVLAVGALPLAWHPATRDAAWRLLTLSPQALRLIPLSGAPATAAETIPLASLVAYQLWLDRDRVFTRYYLRLELTGGRVLRLADPPGAPPNDPPGSVPLNELVAQLAHWVGSNTVVRPPFWQTPVARGLRLLSWLAVGAALVLRWVGYMPTAVIVLAFAGGYLVSHYLVRWLAGAPARNLVGSREGGPRGGPPEHATFARPGPARGWRGRARQLLSLARFLTPSFFLGLCPTPPPLAPFAPPCFPCTIRTGWPRSWPRCAASASRSTPRAAPRNSSKSRARK